MTILYYNANKVVYDKCYPGQKRFMLLHKVFESNISIIDRSESIVIPFKTFIPSFLQIPSFVRFDESIESIIDKRAIDLIELSLITNRKIVVMYSGGVDSSTILVSMLKNYTKNELGNVIVLMNENSIKENRNLYDKYIIKNFQCLPSYRYIHYIGNDDYFFVTGENSDQLFGSAINNVIATHFGFEALFKPIEDAKGILFNWIDSKLKNHDDSKFVFDLLFLITKKCPVPVETLYHLFWWINFTLKWQDVYLRCISIGSNPKCLKLEENYTSFFCTKDFQLWSMNNTDKFILDNIRTTKYPLKQYLYDFNKDKDYLLKPKVGSLGRLTRGIRNVTTISDKLEYSQDFPDGSLLNNQNSFVGFQ